MRKLRIGQIGPLNLPIPPAKYGGTERIIFWLCEELKKRGHEIFLFAAKDSKTQAKLVPIIDKSLWNFQVKEAAPYYAYEMAVVSKQARQLKLDILHDHLGPWSLALYGQNKIPIIHTLHVPLSKDRAWAYGKLNAALVSISNNQREVAPDLRYIATIYNGIDLDFLKFKKRPGGNYLLFTGELSRRKGILEAIRVAKLAKRRLLVAGRIPSSKQKEDFAFFQKYVKPELNKGWIRYTGEETRQTLRKLYQNAAATLFPIQWEEPFGLVMVESMACGTPVIAFERGSVREIITHDRTGFIVRGIHGMVNVLDRINSIDRGAVRKHAEQNFSKERMVDEYEKLYYELCRRRK